MKTKKNLLSALLLLSACAISAQSLKRVEFPELKYTATTIQNQNQPKGLILDVVDNRLLFCLDKDNDVISISLLETTDNINYHAVSIVRMKKNEAHFSYTKGTDQSSGYYIVDNAFNIVIGGLIGGIQIRIEVLAATDKGRKVSISNRGKEFISYWW